MSLRSGLTPAQGHVFMFQVCVDASQTDRYDFTKGSEQRTLDIEAQKLF